MTVTSLLTLLLAFLVVHASASNSGSLGETMSYEDSFSVTAPTSSSMMNPDLTLAPINIASSTSTTFQLVDNIPCNATVSDKIYVIYNKNRALFNLCVTDAQYQIFPFLGTEPSAAQIHDMSSSMPCIAVFTGMLFVNFPQCSISGFPLKASVETMLKIHVDLAYGWAASPTAKRFQEMLSWRRCVNLAKDAGVPYDSESQMYAEYEENLYIAQSNSSIRMLSNYQIEYKLASGSWYDADGEDYAVVGIDDGTVGTVSAGDSAPEVSDSEAGYVRKNSATADNSAPVVVVHGVISVLVSLLLSALFMTY